MKFVNCIFACLILVGCNSAPNPSPVPKIVDNSTNTSDAAFICENVQLTSPMTKEQMTALENRNYNFIYTSENKTSKNIYSINRADTLCAGERNSSVGKIVSGFIVGINQPKDKEYPQDINGITYRYLRVRFIDRDGKEFDYWLQISGLTPDLDKFQIVSWQKPISNTENIFDIFAGMKNSDGTESVSPVSDIISQQLVKVNDQFIAIVHVGNYDGEKVNTTEMLYRFIQAVEGKAPFPSSAEGYRLMAGALLVSSHP